MKNKKWEINNIKLKVFIIIAKKKKRNENEFYNDNHE